MEPAEEWEEDEWEAVDNDGFVYKRKKRRRSHPKPTSDLAAQHDNLKKRRRDTLLKVRERYKAEISQWELLSNTSKALLEEQRRLGDEASTSGKESGFEVGFAVEKEGFADSGIRRRIDELEIRVETDHAVMQAMSNLCDTAEAICNAQEQRLKKKFLDLPIWKSPREMMAVLCDTHSKADNGEGDTRSG